MASAPETPSSPPTGEPSAAQPDPFAAYSEPGLVYECVSRGGFGYTCNNAYAAAPKLFPADAAVLQSLMRLAVRVGAGKPLGGEAEVVADCVPEQGRGDAYPCLYLAEVDGSSRGKAAHRLACKRRTPEGEVPVAGGSAACADGKPVRITPLPNAEAADVKGCLACGRDPSTRESDVASLASGKACTRLLKRLDPREASFVEKVIAPRCPKGS